MHSVLFVYLHIYLSICFECYVFIYLFNQLLSLKDKISWKVFAHVALQANLIQKSINSPKISSKKLKNLKKFPKRSYKALLQQLHSWINNLNLKKDNCKIF